MIGVNKFRDAEKPSIELLKVNPEVEEKQKRRLELLGKERDKESVKKALVEIKRIAESKENLMPVVLDAVKSYVTLGEICSILKEVFGEYRPMVRL